jgi:hypothetical protein
VFGLVLGVIGLVIGDVLNSMMEVRWMYVGYSKKL